MRNIRVIGTGQIKVKPDMTRLDITLENFGVEYDETIRLSVDETEYVRDLLTTFGFERSDLKTLSFTMDPEFEHYEEDNAYKQRHIGFVYSHLMKIEFPSDNNFLGKIMTALATAIPVNPQFRISYFVKDEEAAKNELLGKAILDAKQKALVLTQAAGVQLKDIQNIDYSWGKVRLEVGPIRWSNRDEMRMSDDSAGYDFDIEPDDICVSDTVTVVWEIE